MTSICGLWNALREERKVRLVFFALVCSIMLGNFMDVGYFQIFMIAFAWVIALICELFNTALEKALDYASGKEIHSLIRQGKDYGSACTFIAVIFAIMLTLVLSFF